MSATNVLGKTLFSLVLLSSTACSLVTGSDKLSFTRDPNGSGGTASGGSDGSGGSLGTGGDVLGTGGDTSTCSSEGVVLADDFEAPAIGAAEPINLQGCVIDSGVVYGDPTDCVFAYSQNSPVAYGDARIRLSGIVGVSSNLEVTRIALNVNDDDTALNGLRVEVNNWNNPTGGEVVIAEAGNVLVQLPFAAPSEELVYVELSISGGSAVLNVSQGGYPDDVGASVLATSDPFGLEGLAGSTTAYAVVSGYDAILEDTFALLDEFEVTEFCPIVGL